jgi:V8-like Glu-specific endopeptidase
MADKMNTPTLAERPLLPDELAAVADIAPTEAVPEHVASALATPRLYIHGDSEPGRPKAVQEGSSRHSAWSVELPPGAFLGRPGASGERLDRSSHKLPHATHTSGMRPAWAAQSVQSRRASETFIHTAKQRIKGAQVEPYYGVYPPDQRQVYLPNSYPWRCIGRIFTWTNWAGGGGWTWWGSGVLVGPRHVLTAGHVCPWGSSSWAMRFVPSYWNGSPLLGPGAQSWTSDFRGWNTNDTVAANDFAVLRLYDPIGPWLGWMGTKVYDSSWNGGPYWTLAGYPGAIAGAQRPSDQSGIPVLDTDNDGDAQEIEHHGSATAGDSGGPFFGFWNDGPYAVGTTSGGESITGGIFGWGDEDNNIEAGGLGMVELVQWAQANWP